MGDPRAIYPILPVGDCLALLEGGSAAPPPLYVRRAATHGLRLDHATSRLHEVQLQSPIEQG